MAKDSLYKVISYKGMEIRKYRKDVFTDDLENIWLCDSDGNTLVKMHKSVKDAKQYIDTYIS